MGKKGLSSLSLVFPSSSGSTIFGRILTAKRGIAPVLPTALHLVSSVLLPYSGEPASLMHIVVQFENAHWFSILSILCVF